MISEINDFYILQDWSLSIRLFSVISQTLVIGGDAEMQSVYSTTPAYEAGENCLYYFLLYIYIYISRFLV